MPEIRKNLEEIVNRNPAFKNFKNAAPHSINNNHEVLIIKDELLQIKKEIESIITDPDLLSIYIQELQNMAIEKGISKEILQQAFQKELMEHKKNTVQIRNVPQGEINNLNIDIYAVTKEKNIEVNNQVQSTNTELLNTKAETVEVMVNNIKDQIKMIKKQVRFATRGEGKDSRAVKRYIIERLNLADKRVNKYQRYHKKFDEKDHVLKLEHEAAMFAKISTLLTNSKDYISQAITGDLDEAKNFFHPNIFEDASFYIPDRTPSKSTRKRQVGIGYETLASAGVNEYTNTKICERNRILLGKGPLKERIAQNGLLGAIDAGIEKVGASPETRARAYQAGNLIWSAAKIGGTIRAGWNFLKSSFNWATGKKKSVKDGDKTKQVSYFGDVAKYGAILAGGYIMGPSIDKLIKGGDTSAWAANLLNNTGATVETSDDKLVTNTNELSQKEKAVFEANTKVSKKLFGDISWSEITTFTNSDGKLDFEQYKYYLESQEGREGERYKLLIEQQANWNSLQNFVFALTGKTYLASKAKLYPNEKFEKNYEELKREADEFVEDYDGSDSANMRESITTIEEKMEKTGDTNIVEFKKQKQQIERQLNILYLKHPKAQPINVSYNTSTKKIELESYGKKTPLIIESNNSRVITPLNSTERKTENQNEAWRVAHLINFLTDPRHQFVGNSLDKEPFNISRFKEDIEFTKQPLWNGLKQLDFKDVDDISVLNDSFFSNRLEELYPSIAHNKEGFIQWLNNFKQTNGDSLWSKPRI